MTTNRVGFVTVDEDMDLDAVKVVLEKDGEQVPFTMARNPEPGRYEVHLDEEKGGGA